MLSIRRNKLFIMMILVLFVFAVSGCGSGSTDNNTGDDPTDPGDETPTNSSNYVGTWVSRGIDPAVTLKVQNELGTEELFGITYTFYSGEVICDQALGTACKITSGEIEGNYIAVMNSSQTPGLNGLGVYAEQNGGKVQIDATINPTDENELIAGVYISDGTNVYETNDEESDYFERQ